MNNLTICTPSMRVKNWGRVAESLNEACRFFASNRPHWMIIVDTPLAFRARLEAENITITNHYNPLSIKGSSQRNYVLDNCKSGYIMFHDDDNLFHPEVFNTINELIQQHPDKHLVLSQNRGNNVFLEAKSSNVRPCHIDIAQVILKVDLLNNDRFEHHNLQDGLFYEKLFKSQPQNFLFSPHACVYYNSLV